jgi:hypothetical protein
VSIPSAWPQVLDFFATPLVIELSPSQLATDAGLLPIRHEAPEMAIMYYMAHAMRRLGRVDWTCHTSSPTSMVFIEPATKTRTYAVWNPRPTPTTVDVYERDKRIGQMTAAAQTLTAVTRLTQP